MLLLQNWTDRLETSSTAQRGEEGATLGHIQSIRLHRTDGGKGKVSPRPHFHFPAADRAPWVRRGEFFTSSHKITNSTVAFKCENPIWIFSDSLSCQSEQWIVCQLIQRCTTRDEYLLNLNRKRGCSMKKWNYMQTNGNFRLKNSKISKHRSIKLG